MLKLSNETKIGLLAVAAIALGIWGFKFLKGINALTASQTFYIKYDNVDQLRPSSPVFINGLQVGMVKDIFVDPEDDKTIIAVINLDRGIDIPKDAIATIISASIMGGKAIDLDIPHPCSGPDCAQSGAYLTGRTKSFIESVVGNPEEMDVYLQRLRIGLTAIYDSIADPNDPQGFGRTLVAMQHALNNIALMTHKINLFLDASTAGLSATANNTADITRAIRDSNKSITAMLENLSAVSGQMKDARFDLSGQKAAVLIDSLTLTAGALRQTLSSTQSAIAKLDTLATGLAQGEGSMGLLLHDREFYDNMVRTTRHLQLLMQDLRLNPKRYTTVKLKVFGKNRTKGYVNPLEDPAYQMMADSLERDYSQRLKQ
ncbi:MAG: MCE family protein [Saprospirales bacterium]|jgi:phospholipid/cholesterol/gamma-HCH transport system substrate-binding protein|nr:MCE family protein [Saprospirales bacterium]